MPTAKKNSRVSREKTPKRTKTKQQLKQTKFKRKLKKTNCFDSGRQTVNVFQLLRRYDVHIFK